MFKEQEVTTATPIVHLHDKYIENLYAISKLDNGSIMYTKHEIFVLMKLKFIREGR